MTIDVVDVHDIHTPCLRSLLHEYREQLARSDVLLTDVLVELISRVQALELIRIAR